MISGICYICERWFKSNNKGGKIGKMIIEKVNKPKYLNLVERLEAFYKKPIDEIYVESTPEVGVGDPVGNEQW